jgi:hypothetical protein
VGVGTGATRLTGDGVQVRLDKWDLKEGQDKHKFMEQMVHDPEISKVLVICDRRYKKKADDRTGGVGTESQIISKEVYENTGQSKFIPILSELDDQRRPYLPHFMSSRIYIDLSTQDTFEENYEKLLRNLYDRPLLKRPPLGAMPVHIADVEQPTLRTTQQVRALQSVLVAGRSNVGGFISDFLDTFIASLEEFRLPPLQETTFDDLVVESIEKLMLLRDDFIRFSIGLFKYQDRVDLGTL